VFLEGIVYDMRERDAMRVAAENVAGVTEVCDHLDYLDPVGGVMYGA
jgi:osmotically-inducible protein OsmY